MIGRRLTYGALLIAAIALHIAYGQYVTHYILWFMLLLPILSLLLSLPAILLSRAELSGGTDVQRGRASTITLKVSTRFFLPPEAWKITVEHKNLFLDERPTREKLRLDGARKREQTFEPDTERLGTISYRIRSARACDYLGLFAIPIRKQGDVALTVMPNAEAPVPMPDLVESSARVLKPKPIGFSEEHELRPYREGDAINLIHWKLSEKTGATIVREPQEQVRKRIVLCMDLHRDYAAQQSATEQLCCLSDILNENKIPFLLCYGLHTVTIDGDGDLKRFFKAMLSEPSRDEPAQVYAEGNDTLVYRIVPAKGVDA